MSSDAGRDRTRAELSGEITKLRNENDELRAKLNSVDQVRDRRFRLLLENLPDAIFVHDLKGNFLHVNRVACANLGIDREQLTQMSVQDVDGEAISVGDWTRTWQRQPYGEAILIKTLHKRANGTRYPAEIHLNKLDLDGETVIVAVARDVTQLEVARQEIDQSRKTMRALLDASRDPIFLIDCEGRVLECNRVLAANVKADAESLTGKAIYDFLPKQVADLRRSKVEEVISTKSPVSFADERDGREFEHSLLPVFDDDGEVSKIAIYGRDVTDENRAVAALREAERRKDLILNSTREMFAYYDRELRIVWANRAAAASIGEDDTAKLVGRHCYEVWQGRTEPCEGCPVLRTLETGEPLEAEMQTPDGRFFHLRSYPVFDDNGVISNAVEFGEDITERRIATIALKESEELFRSLVDNMDMAICQISPQMRVTAVNRKMRELYPDRDFSECPKCYDVFRDGLRSDVCDNCPIMQAFTDKQPHEVVSSSEHFGARRHHRVHATPVLDEAGDVKTVIKTVEDITDRIKYEQEVARAEKLESLGILAGGIAHDFNNILVGILGSISLAKLDVDKNGPIYELLDDAEDAAFRAKGLTHQLLTFSKGGAPVKRTSDIRETLRNAAVFSCRGSRCKCEFDFEDDLWYVNADESQLSQVINNLVLNAIQAMPEGGEILLSARNRLLTGDSKSTLHDGKYVEVSVQDTGSGIPGSLITRVFDPFFTTKPSGSGLGLSSSYSIVKRHGGNMEVESEIGSGSTFRFLLPASESRLSNDNSIPGTGDESRLISGAGRILVVDDEPSILKVAKYALKKLGYDAVTVSDGSEGEKEYHKALAEGNPFAAVITDLTIPGGVGGVELAGRISSIDPSAKILVASGYSTDPVMSNYREYGFVGRISKPFRVEELSHELKSAVRRQVDNHSGHCLSED